MSELAIAVGKGIGGLVFLTVGAELLVRGATALALRLRISALAVGLTVVAFGTSAPELVVSVRAALRGANDIALGNVVGSNICNIALILGLAALIRPLEVHLNIFRLDAPLLIVVSAALVAMVLGGGISRIEGALLCLGLLGYTAATLWRARRAEGPVEAEFAEGMHPTPGGLGRSVTIVLLGLALLVLGADLLVTSAIVIATALHVSQAVIGLTIVAVGTSLPELATSVVAAAKGQGDIAVGNVVGSNLFNILGILGLASVIQPISLGGITGSDLAVMLFLAIALVPIARTGFRISRLEGAGLLACYAGYLGWLIAA